MVGVLFLGMYIGVGLALFSTLLIATLIDGGFSFVWTLLLFIGCTLWLPVLIIAIIALTIAVVVSIRKDNQEVLEKFRDDSNT